MGSPASGDGAGRAAAALFLPALLLYLLSTGGHVYAPDGVVMARTAESLATQGSLAVEDPGYPPGFVVEGRGGRSFAKYGVALPLVAVPFAWLGVAFELAMPPAATAVFGGPRFLWYDALAPEAWRFFGLSLTNAFVAAATVALTFLLACEMGFRRRAALLAAITLALASPLPVYAKTFFAEPLVGLAFTAAALGVVRGSRAGLPGPYAAAGAALGVALLAKPAFAVAVVPFALAVAMARAPLAVRAGRLAALAAGPLAAAVVWAGVNILRFGGPLATGYAGERFSTPFVVGLHGLLASPGRGLVVYFPAAIAAAVATPRLARRSPAAALLAWGVVVAILAVHAPWHGWDGGWCWGPRFLVPALPLLAVALAPVWEGETGPAVRWSAAGLVVLSLAINLTGTLVPFTEYHQALRQVVGGEYLGLARWSWGVFPPWAYWHMPKTYWLATAAWSTPAAWPLAAAFGALAGALGPAAWWAAAIALGRPAGPRRLREGALALAIVGAIAGALVAIW